MDSFSISQLGRYAGVKPHTIRAWEKRYKALRPDRSKGNKRYYDGSQMRRILNIVSLIKAGHKVSKLCLMTDDQLSKLLHDFYGTNGNETPEYFISQLISAGMAYDEAYFDRIFTRCIFRYKLKQAYVQVLLPMLFRIGILWKCNKASVAQEHFISNILRQKLFSAADAVPVSETGAGKWLLFLPENEFHDIGLLLAYNLIRLSGQHAIYLGSSVPMQVLRSAIQQIEPDNVFIFLVNRDYPKTLKIYLEEVMRHFTHGNIYVASHRPVQVARTPARKRIRWLRTVDDLTELLLMN